MTKKLPLLLASSLCAALLLDRSALRPPEGRLRPLLVVHGVIGVAAAKIDGQHLVGCRMGRELVAQDGCYGLRWPLTGKWAYGFHDGRPREELRYVHLFLTTP